MERGGAFRNALHRRKQPENTEQLLRSPRQGTRGRPASPLPIVSPFFTRSFPSREKQTSREPSAARTNCIRDAEARPTVAFDPRRDPGRGLLAGSAAGAPTNRVKDWFPPPRVRPIQALVVEEARADPRCLRPGNAGGRR